MGEWDDERASITGREINSNIPRKAIFASARDRKILFFAIGIPMAILFVIAFAKR